jgi:hypothetical protein
MRDAARGGQQPDKRYFGAGKGERRLLKIRKRLLYCVNVNRTSLDHLLLGKCADVDRNCRMK